MFEDIDRIIVENTRTGEVLAVITEDEVTTASDEIVVRMRPVYDRASDDQVNANDSPCKPYASAVVDYLTNPANVFAALSGALIAHFIIGPLLFG